MFDPQHCQPSELIYYPNEVHGLQEMLSLFAMKSELHTCDMLHYGVWRSEK